MDIDYEPQEALVIEQFFLHCSATTDWCGQTWKDRIQMELNTSEEMSPKFYTNYITNFKSGETINHPLIILKGRIVASNREPVNGNLSVQNCDKSLDWPVKSGHYKVLVMLTKGWNEIVLNYEEDILVLKLQFEFNDTGYYVIPIYIVSFDHDGHFQGPHDSDCSVSSARTRITFASRLLQSILAEKLRELGLGRQTFTLWEEEGCVLHKSALSVKEAQTMKQEELWEYYGREIVRTFGKQQSKKFKFLAFLACTRYEGKDRDAGLSYKEILASTKGHVALGGGGLAIFGTGCLHTWPTTEEEVLPCLHSKIPGVMGRGFDHMNLVLGEEEEISSEIHSTIDFTVNLQVDCQVQKKSVESNQARQHSTVSKPQCRQGPPSNSTDKTFFTKSCAYLLAYHRWFIKTAANSDCDISFDEISWTLKSPAGVRVVEVREGDRQVVRASWCFPQARQLFVVPRSTLPSKMKPPLLLLAEDSVGNIIRHKLNLDENSI
ncbi:hypothetical protein B566_EDAN008790 [Ephemera danica]|nr:hypothetical protein B566_EDAN008790 [Ephemera danica]